MIDDEAGGVRHAGDAAGGYGRYPLEGREGTVEPIEDAIELDAHLIGERPPGVVVRRNRRPARILEVVWMVLRLEHVERVRAERLRRPYHVRSGGIILTARSERCAGSVHRHAYL